MDSKCSVFSNFQSHTYLVAQNSLKSQTPVFFVSKVNSKGSFFFLNKKCKHFFLIGINDQIQLTATEIKVEKTPSVREMVITRDMLL